MRTQHISANTALGKSGISLKVIEFLTAGDTTLEVETTALSNMPHCSPSI